MQALTATIFGIIAITLLIRCGNCERFYFSCKLRAFVSRFQQSRIRALRKIFGREGNHKGYIKCRYKYLKKVRKHLY